MIGRTFGNAIIRRAGWIVGGLIVYAILSAFGIGVGRAEAACYGNYTCDTRPEAYLQADATHADYQAICASNAWGSATHQTYMPNATSYSTDHGCSGLPANGWMWTQTNGQWSWLAECPAGYTWDDVTKTCKQPKTCSASDPPLGEGTYIMSDNIQDFDACYDGCSYIDNDDNQKYSKIDGSYWINTQGWIPEGATCTAGAGDNATPPSDGDGDGSSDGNDSSPNNPGETGPQPPPPACGGAGQPPCPSQESDPNQSSGGGDCATPPNSTGDPILAQIAYQTWATRCAGERSATKLETGVNVTVEGGGTGTDMTATNAKLDGIAGKLDGILGKLGEWLDGFTGPGEGSAPDPMSVWDAGTDELQPDSAGYGLPRSCPAPPTFTLAGASRTIDTGPMCELGSILAAILLLAGAAQFIYAFTRS